MSDEAQIDLLSVGSLHEAVLSFSSQPDLAAFWAGVSTGVRWIVPAKRVCILQPLISDRCRVVARMERGTSLPPIDEPIQRGTGVIDQVLSQRKPTWLDDPWREFTVGDELRRWLVDDTICCSQIVPVATAQHHLATLILDQKAPSSADDRARLTALASLYARHAASAYSVIRSTEKLNEKNLALEQTKLQLMEAMSEIKHLNATLEERIALRTRELEDAHAELVELSRQAGMAEVASGVLHNVGNVLNSINVSTGLLADKLSASVTRRVAPVVGLLEENAGNLDTFMADDTRGKQLLPYLAQLAQSMDSEHCELSTELNTLRDCVDHLKIIVGTHQSFAGATGVTQCVEPSSLLEDALGMAGGTLGIENINVVRLFDDVGALPIDRHRVMQILVNLLSNAKHALCEVGDERQLTLAVRMSEDGQLQIVVEDTGVGIKPENLERIFAYGFTTKRKGHGFGLHNSALSAAEMGGTLTCNSDGPGCGARFVLSLPVGEASQVVRISQAESGVA